MKRYSILETKIAGVVTVVWNEIGVSNVLIGQNSRGEAQQLLDEQFTDAEEGKHEVVALITSYFAGEMVDFSPITVDFPKGTIFQKAVWLATRQIEYGKVNTYGEIANKVSPGAQRAIGQALSKNPVPIIIPCHRVIAAGHRLGGFSGKLNLVDIKTKLLALEGVNLSAN